MRHLHHTLGSGALLVVMVAGCGRAPGPEAKPPVEAAPEPTAEPRAAGLDLAGTEWVLETLAGELLETDVRPTVTFDAEGGVAGNAGCNRYHGEYAVDGDAIAVGHLGATQMICAADQMAREDRFLDALGRADRVAVRDGLLVLRFGEPAQELVFAGVEPRPAVAGAVVYRERIALPPDAALTVRLLDVSRGGAPAVVLAEQVITPTGQVPIPFEVPYDPAQIDDEMSCTLEARIEAGGALIFVSNQAFPVITGGSPSKDLEVMVERTGG